MKMMRLVMNMAFVAMALQLASATDYIVGSPSGSWDESTNLQTWASSKKFFVGDNLIFKHTPMHNVLEVSETDYESCTTGNPIMTDTSGNVVVPLKASGKRYFICGIMGHCQILGMKMEVDINPSSPGSPKPPSFSPSHPPPSFSTPSHPPPSFSTPSHPPPSFSTPSHPSPAFSPPSHSPPSFVPHAPPHHKSHFAPHSPRLSAPPTASKTPQTFSPTALAPSTIAVTPKASPYGGASPVGSPLMAQKSSSTAKGGFKPMVGIVIAMALIATHGF